MSKKIKCPECSYTFSLSDALSNDEIQSLLDVDVDLQVKQKINEYKKSVSSDLEKKDQEFNLREKKLLQKEKEMEIEAENKLTEYKMLVQKENSEKFKNFQEEISAKDSLLNELKANKSNIETDYKMKLENQKKEMEIEAERLKTQHELEMKRMQNKLEDVSKGAGADVELIGESFEEQVKNSIIKNFPRLPINDVEKGAKGADHILETNKGGYLLIEAKNVKNWSNNFITKLRSDIENTGANHGIIVTSGTMPKEGKGLDYLEIDSRVSIVKYSVMLPIIQLKVDLIDFIIDRDNDLEGNLTKKEQLYSYIRSEKFRNRVKNVIDSIAAIKSQLQKEKDQNEKNFIKRETDLSSLSTNFLKAFDAEINQYLEKSDDSENLLLDSE